MSGNSIQREQQNPEKVNALATHKALGNWQLKPKYISRVRERERRDLNNDAK